MIKILLVTSEKEPFSEFAKMLKKNDDVELSWIASGHETLEAISQNPVDLIIVDENIGDMTGIEFMEKLLRVNPMINCAAVSQMPSEDFHEASEGLGVLAQLPSRPGPSEAKDLLEQMKNIKNLLKPEL
jgi:two-component SAPR family response regulator